MYTPLQNLDQHLTPFFPFQEKKAVVFGYFFTKKEATVAEFIAEIQQTAHLLQQQKQPEYAEIYADKLLKQFDALSKAVEKLKHTQTEAPQFRSNFRFSKNPHRLSPEKRLVEYRNALRALNEKISWLIEQQLQTQSESQKQLYHQQIQETEYRKKKCLAAIEELEEKTVFKVK